MKRMIISLFVLKITILFLPISSISQSNFSIEAGAAYIFNFSDLEDPEKMENGHGFNLGFNYDLKQETFLDIQFGYMDFPYKDLFYSTGAPQIHNFNFQTKINKNILFYNFSIALRFFFRSEGINPFFSFGVGWHYLEKNTHLSTKLSKNRGYFSFMSGVSIPIFNKLDILINSSLSTSLPSIYIIIPCNIALKYNF